MQRPKLIRLEARCCAYTRVLYYCMKRYSIAWCGLTVLAKEASSSSDRYCCDFWRTMIFFVGFISKKNILYMNQVYMQCLKWRFLYYFCIDIIWRKRVCIWNYYRAFYWEFIEINKVCKCTPHFALYVKLHNISNIYFI